MVYVVRTVIGLLHMSIGPQLPISVTLPALKAKMAEVGDVNFIQITAPGRALINFTSDQDADKCVGILFTTKWTRGS